jgi:hypothetical protein
MISIKTAIVAGTVVIVGFAAYASGAFCTVDIAQNNATQTTLTSGGSQSCCAGEASAQKTVAHNALFTPTVQATALAGGICPAQAKQTAACGTQTTIETAALTTQDNSCCAAEGVKTTTSKTTLAGVVPTATATN